MSEGMNILIFDTSTTACTVALKVNQKFFSCHKEEANIHSLALLEMVDEVLSEGKVQLRDVDYLAVGVGPGSFTGLRIGIGVAQSLAYSNGINIIPISSLEIIALNVLLMDVEGKSKLQDDQPILVAHDARMSEVYSALFQYQRGKRLVLADDLRLSSPQEVIPNGPEAKKTICCGNAWQEYSQSISKPWLNSVIDVPHFPDARKAVHYVSDNLKQFPSVGWAELKPIYVRDNVAKKSLKKV